MLAFTFMFFMNTVNGFFSISMLLVTPNGWAPLGWSPLYPALRSPYFGQKLKKDFFW